jgi:hypothetical protein
MLAIRIRRHESAGRAERERALRAGAKRGRGQYSAETSCEARKADVGLTSALLMLSLVRYGWASNALE